MTVNLMMIADQLSDRRSADWAALTAVAKDAFVPLPNETVTRVASLLDNVILTDGNPIFTYVADKDDIQGSYVGEFGPSLLPEGMLEQVADALGCPGAAKLIKTVAEHGLSVILSGPTMNTPANIKGTSTCIGEVEFNRCESNMKDIFDDLGLSLYGKNEDVPFQDFERAVADPLRPVSKNDMQSLTAFVASCRQFGATAVFWA